MFNGIIINIISAPIILIIGMMFRKKINYIFARHFNPLVHFLSIQKGKYHNNICIVHGYARARCKNKKFLFIEQGDLHALININSILSNIFNKQDIILNDGIDISQFGKNYDNILCVSGPKWNKYTEKIIGDIGSPVCFLKDPKCVSVKTSRMGKPVHYMTETTTDGRVSTCYGFVVCSKINNSSGDSTSVIVCCGRTTYSTNASIALLRDLSNRKGVYKELKRRGVISAQGSLGILFKVSNEDNQKSTELDSFKFTIIQVFLNDDFLEKYKYEYK